MEKPRWKWTRIKDGDGHPCWVGCPRGTGPRAYVWRGGGDAGDYLVESGGRYRLLASAKAAAEAWWDD